MGACFYLHGLWQAFQKASRRSCTDPYGCIQECCGIFTLIFSKKPYHAHDLFGHRIICWSPALLYPTILFYYTATTWNSQPLLAGPPFWISRSFWVWSTTSIFALLRPPTTSDSHYQYWVTTRKQMAKGRLYSLQLINESEIQAPHVQHCRRAISSQPLPELHVYIRCFLALWYLNQAMLHYICVLSVERVFCFFKWGVDSQIGCKPFDYMMAMWTKLFVIVTGS